MLVGHIHTEELLQFLRGKRETELRLTDPRQVELDPHIGLRVQFVRQPDEEVLALGPDEMRNDLPFRWKPSCQVPVVN